MNAGEQNRDGPEEWSWRVQAVLRVARSIGRPISREDLLELLPREGPGGEEELVDRLLSGADAGADGTRKANRSDGTLDASERGELVGTRSQQARGFLEAIPRPLKACLCLAAITGSTAYGSPGGADDLDLFFVTREGSLWAFLAAAFVYQRKRKWRSPKDRDPTYCLNFAMEDTVLPTEFGDPRGFLFARETLMMRPVVGGALLRKVLVDNPWIGEEIPRLYERRLHELPGDLENDGHVPILIRLANLFLYPGVAAYLQTKALFQNHQHRRWGRSESTFRVETGLRRMAVRSRKYELLTALYGQPTASPLGSATSAHGPVLVEGSPTGRGSGTALPKHIARGAPVMGEGSPAKPGEGPEGPASGS